MTKSNEAVSTEAPAVAEFGTKLFKAKYNFKTVKPNTPNHEVLNSLVNEGLLAKDAVETIEDKENGTVLGYKRKSQEVEFSVLDLSTVIKEDTLSVAQVNHLQFLVEKAVELANKEAIDSCSNELTGWDAVLESSPIKRKASTKVTAEMLEAAVLALVEFLQTKTQATEKGISVVSQLAGKKFSVSACRAIPPTLLERMQGLVSMWIDDLSDSDMSIHEPVITVWADALEKLLAPADDEFDEDMFGI